MCYLFLRQSGLILGVVQVKRYIRYFCVFRYGGCEYMQIRCGGSGWALDSLVNGIVPVNRIPIWALKITVRLRKVYRVKNSKGYGKGEIKK